MKRPIVAHVLFSLVTSAMMSALVCALSTFSMIGMGETFVHSWFNGWIYAWPVAFSVLVLIGPLVRKNVYKACQCPLATPQVQTNKELEDA